MAAGPWLVETWERSRDVDSVTRDALLVDRRSDHLRVGVIDGVTPTPETPQRAGVDGAVWAAALVHAALLAHRPLRECAAAAHEALRAEDAPTSRDRPQASLAAVDVSSSGVVAALRAGDAEVWLEAPSGWCRLFPRQIETPMERVRMQHWADEHPDRPYLEYDRARPDAGGIWITAALGRPSQPLLQERHLDEFRSLVLATEGAQLQPPTLRRLDEWLADTKGVRRRRGVSRWEPGIDDLAVVRVRKSP